MPDTLLLFNAFNVMYNFIYLYNFHSINSLNQNSIKRYLTNIPDSSHPYIICVSDVCTAHGGKQAL